MGSDLFADIPLTFRDENLRILNPPITKAAIHRTEARMRYTSLDDYLGAIPAGRTGPVGVLLCESSFLAAESAQRLRQTGFRDIVAIGPGAAAIPDEVGAARIDAQIARPAARAAALNRLIGAHAGRWMLAAQNGEFLFFPFCETRGVGDFTEFLASERRASAMAYAIDLYSDALGRDDARFSPREAYFDTQGWYGFEREGRQAEIFGGVGWRFEEYMPHALQRINRPALFRADPEAPIREDFWFANDEYNAISCPWHNNPTFALMTVRRAAALRSHPNFNKAVKTLMWPCSTRFEWSSEQLLGLGMIEAGQWL